VEKEKDKKFKNKIKVENIRMLTAKDIMNKPLVTIKEDYSVKEAVDEMAIKNIGCVVILSKNGFLEGILTERDIVKLVSEGKDLEKLKVKDVMVKEIVTCSPDTKILEVATLMRDKNIRRVIVVNPEDGKPQGIITSRDLVRLISV